MKKIFLLVIVAAITLSACTSAIDKEKKKIEGMEAELFNENAGMISPEQSEELIMTYMNFADQYAQSADAPEYLFRASDIAMNMGNFSMSLNLLSRIMKDFPDYPKVAQCLFLQGFIWENNIGNIEKARELYEQFLQKYPDNEFADDVELSLRNLGKTPEELIRMFENNGSTEQ